MLVYRLGESMLVKIASPFLLDAPKQVAWGFPPNKWEKCMVL
jgi:hypothetical protein